MFSLNASDVMSPGKCLKRGMDDFFSMRQPIEIEQPRNKNLDDDDDAAGPLPSRLIDR